MDIRADEQVSEALAALHGARAALTRLPFVSIHSVAVLPADLEEARNGVFRIGRSRFRLVPPIDWAHEPYAESEDRGFFQNSFVFADPLLQNDDPGDVIPALAAIFCDWVRQHPRASGPAAHKYDWYDHAVASRLVYMAYVLREGVRRSLLSSENEHELTAAVIEHADWLVADEAYSDSHNHGLFTDAALAIAGRALAEIPEGATWAAKADERFGGVLANTVALDDGVHLEHSPYYHHIIQHALARFADAGLFHELDLAGLVERMEAATTWLSLPDGTLPAVGDGSDGVTALTRGGVITERPEGLRVFAGAGYAVARTGSDYLLVSAGFHPTGHKHADDGSFVLVSAGVAIVTDAGNPGYEYASAERRYGTSPRAHSTATIDDRDWVNDEWRPYGSGIRASGELDGTFAVLVENPVVAPSGVLRRLFLYRPGVGLVIVDQADPGIGATLFRRIHLDSALSCAVRTDGALTIGRDDEQVALLIPDPGADATVERGVREPALSGVRFPAIGRSDPRFSITLASPATAAPRAFAMTLGRETAGPPVASGSLQSGDTVRVVGLANGAMTVRIEEPRLHLTTAGD